MFQQFLVPLDGSTQAAAALPLARTLAAATGAPLTLVRVIPAAVGLAADELEQALATEDALRRIAAELQGGGLEVKTAVRRGEPADLILEQARLENADTIVMATHGRSSVARAVLGSVTKHVVVHSPVPVLLVKPGGRRVTALHTLLVPVDGSVGSALGLGAAVAVAREFGAKLVLFQAALPLRPYAMDPYGGAAYIDPQWEEDARVSAEAYVTGLAARLRRAGLSAEGKAVIGEPVRAISAAAAEADADLIVMSTRGQTGLLQAVLGSVTDGVVGSAGRPVLVVPPGVQAARRTDHDQAESMQPVSAG
jgi:nucleotide-binding universal stress UspA family protein